MSVGRRTWHLLRGQRRRVAATGTHAELLRGNARYREVLAAAAEILT